MRNVPKPLRPRGSPQHAVSVARRPLHLPGAKTGASTFGCDAMIDTINRNLSITARFLLVSAVFLAATLFGAWLVYSEVNSSIAFSSKERDGVAAMRPVWAALRANSAADTAAIGSLASPDEISAFNTASNASARSAAALPLLVSIADNSNLTLDPDLDSFYVMDATSIRLPSALVRGRQLIDRLRAGGDPAEEALRLKLAGEDLRDAVDEARSSLTSSMEHNTDGQVRSALQEPMQALSQAAATLLSTIDAGQSPDGAVAAYEAATDRLWQVSANELDRLLTARVDGMWSELTWVLAALAAAIIAAGLLVWAIAGGLGRRFGALTKVMETLRGGDFKVDVPYTSDRYETGAIAQTLKVLRDSMAERAADDQRRVEEAETGSVAMWNAVSRSQAVIEFSPDGKILSANENFCKVMGYAADEIVGKHHSMFVDAAYRSSPEYPAFWDALNRGTFQAAKFKRIGRDGRAVWIQATYNPIADRSGKVFKIVKFATDVTAEEQRAGEIAFKSAAFSGSSIAMMMVDRDLKITHVNSASTELFTANVAAFRTVWPDFDPAKLIGQCIDRFHKNPAHQRQMLADPSRLPYRTDISVGDLKIELNVSAVHDGTGAHVGNMLQWQDVTAMRMNTSKLKALDLSQAVIEFTLDGKIVSANENFCRTLGYSLDEIAGRHHSMFIDATYRNTNEYKAFWDALARGEYQSGKFERIGRGGRQIWIQAVYNPVLDASGKPYRVVKFASDITDVENERRAAEADREARAVEQEHVVSALATGLKALSEGDLTSRLLEAFAGQYEQLRVDFNHAAEQLQETMKSVIVNASGIRTGAGEITQAADDLSKRTEQQAASLEETAAALDEITATVKKSAEGAKQAHATVGTTKANAEASGLVVQKTVAAMAEIEKSSKQISQIIGVIDEIAFQTNLLALNAGVEAARAGDAGRGFAVVASEVRALAQRSSDAAKEIKDLISASSQQVESGVRLVGEAGKALSDIATHVTEISDLVSGIAASAQEQSTALAEVNTAVNQMDQVTQQNAAMVEQSTAASHSLNQETSELMTLIARFKTGANVVDIAPTVQAKRSPAPPRAPGQSITQQKRRIVQFASAANAVQADDADWQEF